jgi:hypothetical protein
MSEIQGQKSNEIRPLNRIKDEYPSFIIEIAGEPSNPQYKGGMSLASACKTRSPCNSHETRKSCGQPEVFFSNAANSWRSVRFARTNSDLTALIETPSAAAMSA